MNLDKNYWSERYENQNTPWDIGHVSPPLKSFLDSLERKDLKILIPGAGKAHEGIYLHESGFSNVFICDWADTALNVVRENCPDFPEAHLLEADFFKLEGDYDIILEQTFFCAIDPALRNNYAEQAHQLLTEDGILAGLLFGTVFSKEGPPFGGTKEEYVETFKPLFIIEKMGVAVNSIAPRLGNELFFQLRKKNI